MRRAKLEQVNRRRLEILTSARVCFGRLGLLRASISDICAEMGSSAGNIYHYFANKDELIDAVVQDSVDRAIQGITELFEGRAVLEACCDLGAVARIWKESWGMTPGLRLELVAEAERSQSVRATLHLQSAEVTRIIMQAVTRDQAAGMLAGDINPAELSSIVAMIWGGLSVAQFTDARFTLESYGQALRHLLQPWCNGQENISAKS